MRSIFFAILTSLFAVANADDRTASCEIPRPNAGIEEIAKWAEDTGDLLGNSFLRKRSNGDMQTSFGTLIDKSCWQKRSPKEYREWLDRVESAIAHAMTQTKRCEKVLGLPVLSDVIPKIRRMRINCNDFENHTMAADYGVITSPRLAREYELVNWSHDATLESTDWLASNVLHEALHWTASNNRHWHAKASEKETGKCENSVFADRIYLTTAACFPLSLRGWSFYTTALDCPGVCESAFTESDPNAPDWFRAHVTRGGDRIIAKKHSADEAALLCGNIRKNRKRFQSYLDSMKAIGLRTVKTIDYLKKAQDPNSFKELDALLLANTSIVDAAFTPGANLAKSKKQLADKAAEIRRAISTTCARADLNADWNAFCKMKENPVDATLTYIQTKINELREDDSLLYISAKQTTAPHPLYSPRKEK